MLAGWMPQNVSTFGGQIDHVVYLILYIVGFFFILAEGLLIYFAVSSRRKGPRQAHYNRGDTPREAAWILIPALVILVLDLGIDAAGNRAWSLEKLSRPPNTIRDQGYRQAVQLGVYLCWSGRKARHR